ncbi:MAG: discoidin domain-containing protein [Bacteroidota bacterium]
MIVKKRGRSLKAFFIVSAALLIAAFPLAIQQNGLDQLEPVAQFADGAFPVFTPGSEGGWYLEDVYPNLEMVSPIQLLPSPTSPDSMYVSLLGGQIYKFRQDEDLDFSKMVKVLDINEKVKVTDNSGMYGFAFHPEFANPVHDGYGSIFIHYRYAPDSVDGWGPGFVRVARYNLFPTGGKSVEETEIVLVQQYDRHHWHDGGGIFFGADGFLYFTIGDEGDAYDYSNVGQKIDYRMMSGMFRIDVDMDGSKSHPIRRQPAILPGDPMDSSYTANYYVPNDNPWQDVGGGILEEYFALGLRSPFRATLDTATNRIWLSDVGQFAREEIDTIAIAHNYAWPFREGSWPGPVAPPSDTIGIYTEPIMDFNRDQAVAAIAGYVYHGQDHDTSIANKFIFADFGTRVIRSYDVATGNMEYMLSVTQGKPASFGYDHQGELYVLVMTDYATDGGKIMKLSRQTSTNGNPPALLSQTGIFTDIDNLVPADFMIPYELNVPFWSDGALKKRWLILPFDGEMSEQDEQIIYSENDPWELPIGAVTVKHFEFQVDDNDPSNTRRLETRFIVRGLNGDYYGLTYRWLQDQSDAVLLDQGMTDTLKVKTKTTDRTVLWEYPSRGQCMTCHNDASGAVLGPKTRQLNGDIYYPLTGRTANQLKTLAELNVFHRDIDTTTAGMAMKDVMAEKDDLSRSLDERAKSYLDANCASCHRPGNTIHANFDARYNTPLAYQNLIFAEGEKDLGIDGSRVILPGDTAMSLLYKRIAAVHTTYAMPPAAKNIVDTPGVALIAEWINSMSPNVDIPGCTTAVSQASWSLQYVDSEELVAENGQGSNAFDGDANTFWHTEYHSNNGPLHPHEIQIDLGQVAPIVGMKYLPRQDGPDGGTITSFLFYLSMDGVNWGKPVADGLWEGTNEKTVYFSAQKARYIRLVGLAEPNGWEVTSAAEINLFQLACEEESQMINFADIPDKNTTDAPFALSATSTSGLPVTFEVSGVATLTGGNTINLTGAAGEVLVTARQDGNSTYKKASEVVHHFWVFPPGSGTGTGLLGNYFSDIDTTNLTEVRTDAQINFEWGSSIPIQGQSFDNFSVVWEGEIEAPYDETVTFTTTSDNGVRLWVDGQLIIDQWNDHARMDHSGSVDLDPFTKVPIKMAFYEKDVFATAILSWSSPIMDQQVVPTQFLYPAAGSTFPVELTEFEAFPEGGQVAIRWTTEQEINSDYFLVERSADADIFQPLVELDAAGNSQVPLSYQTFDTDPFRSVTYYRLKMVDIDGTFSYSNTVEVSFGDVVSIYPNPVSLNESVWINLNLGNPQPVQVEVVNSSGQVVKRAVHNMQTPQEKYQVSLDGLSRGLYFVHVKTTTRTEVQKLLVH